MRHHLIDTQNLLRSVDIVFQVMVKAAQRHDGLFPAVAERQNGTMLMDFPLPAPIPGQRNSDRSARGCNLSHDVGLLAALDGLDRSLNRPRYSLLRENYLTAFATVCAPPSPTGLLPWGEHSFWNLQHGVVGNGYLLQYGEQPLDAGIPTHHQLATLPLRDWQSIHAANPLLIPRFVDGLDWHWDDEERTQFNRHAPITQFVRAYQVKRGAQQTAATSIAKGGSDFPGAAGVFIHDYAVALALVAEPKASWRQDLGDFSDYWWSQRLPNGLLPKSSGTSQLSWNGASIGQTLSFADSLIEAGRDLSPRDAGLGGLLIERGGSLAKALLDAPQDRLDEGRFCTSWNDDGSPFQYTQPWAGNRGLGSTAQILVRLLHCSQAAGDPRGLELVERCARIYRECFLPRDTIVRAGDPGAVIGLTGELYRLTGEQAWRDCALAHATDAMELYFDSPLPRVATGRNHYEAQQGSSILVHALARLLLIADGVEPQGGLAEVLS